MTSIRLLSSSPIGKHKLVMMRHGSSKWSTENRFTGWFNIPLDMKAGYQEAVSAAKLIKQAGYKFDIAFTSVLQRAQKTLEIVLKELKLESIPIRKTWRLNERHYGALTAMDKLKAVEKYGVKNIKVWRRSFDITPPPITKEHPYYDKLVNDECYKDGPPQEEFPMTEALKQVHARVAPYYRDQIVPQIKAGKRVLLVTHGSTCRALILLLEGVSKRDIFKVNIPTAMPFLYFFDRNMKVLPEGNRKFLGDPETVKKAIYKVEHEIDKK